MDILKQDIQFIPGIGTKKAEILNKEINIFSLEDLLYYFPYKYIDRSRIFLIREIDGNMPYIQLKGKITFFETVGEGRNNRLVAKFTDGTGFIDLVWFKGLKYIVDKYKYNKEYIIFGKPTVFGSRLNIAHPEIEPAEDFTDKKASLYGLYNTTEKMKNHYLNSKAIQKIMFNLLQSIKQPFPETLPEKLVETLHLIPLDQALRNIHFPQNPDILRKAEYRLKFEELFYIQMNILRYTRERQEKVNGFVFDTIGDYFNNFYSRNLPFELTNAQKRVIREIRRDVGSGKQMNRLLQGDVGSGKTLIALMVMLMALDNGFQASMMVPTEILANQHFENIQEFLKGLDIRVELLTGSTKKKKRAEIHEALLAGEIHILIGTHALIEDTVVFSNLGMVIIDEQHRFGVAQRARLWKKNTMPPHVLVMTATPIPRTLAMTVYGDLDVSVIDELPPGRKPIQTILQHENQRASLYNFIRKQVQAGRQVYIVYPLIQESEKMDYKNLTDGYEQIKEIFPEFEVCMVHGKMPAVEKEEQMQRFVKNEAQIMVATTVIEVGVNVPNASVMIIENAERFGLSQLHQLRGRVGRGASQSYCILATTYNISADTRKRLSIMTDSNDGFEIAEADLKLRGPGDLEGTLQSGDPFDLKIAHIVKDAQIMQYAREVADAFLDDDPHLEKPENQIIIKQLERRRKSIYNWGIIS